MREGLVRTVMSDPERMARVEAHRASVAAELAAILDRFTKPTEREDVPITFDPDDYPLI